MATLDPATQGAFDLIVAQLRAWGIDQLADTAKQLIVQGLDSNSVLLQLQDSDAYKQRFIGNESRKKNGLGVLAPADYIATEAAYRSALLSYGLPSGFYDQPSDFANFIGNNVSATEVAQRASVAQSIWLSQDEETKDTWRQWYGLSDGEAIASILDPDKAMPIITRSANAAKYGGEATRLGLTPDQQRYELYSDLGLTADSVTKGLQQVAAQQDQLSKIGDRFGTKFDQALAEKADIMNDGSANKTKQRLIGNETALFAGRTGTDSAALTRQSGGQF
jgi:hypothetical protein